VQPAYFFRRLVRLTLSGLADRVRAMPRLRALAINILRHFPWLDRVLRAALRPTPPGSPRPRGQVRAHAARSRLARARHADPDLPLTAAKIYAQLLRASLNEDETARIR
jgi:hypothetical protein